MNQQTFQLRFKLRLLKTEKPCIEPQNAIKCNGLGFQYQPCDILSQQSVAKEQAIQQNAQSDLQ